MKINSETKKFKSSVLQLVDPEAGVFFSEKDGSVKAQIVAYSGKDIPHFWWGKLALDLEGRTQMKVIPILEQHELDRKIGFTKKSEVSDDFRLVHNDITFVDTPFSEEFQKLSKQGFPYQASVYAKPSVIEDVGEGTTVEVNGRKFTGPGSIFRKWEHKETSVCVFGADKNTHSQVFSENDEFEVTVFRESENIEVEVTVTQEEVKTMFDIVKLKEENPEEYKKLMDAVKAEARQEVESQFKEVVETLTESNQKLQKDVLEFQKTEAIRKEKEIKLEAKGIWDEKLSGMPERLHSKIKAQVNYEQFVKEGDLDVEAFSAAIDEELKDWTDVSLGSSVNGFGAASKGVADDPEEVKAQEENKVWLTKMLSKAGQSIK
jgi:hypothetical protein